MDMPPSQGHSVRHYPTQRPLRKDPLRYPGHSVHSEPHAPRTFCPILRRPQVRQDPAGLRHPKPDPPYPPPGHSDLHSGHLTQSRPGSHNTAPIPTAEQLGREACVTRRTPAPSSWSLSLGRRASGAANCPYTGGRRRLPSWPGPLQPLSLPDRLPRALGFQGAFW